MEAVRSRVAYREVLHPTTQDRIELLDHLAHRLGTRGAENLFELAEQGRPFLALSAFAAASIVPGDSGHDDESALRKVIRASLAVSGFAVEEAGTGGDALGMVPQRPFDLVLLDVSMPGMSGLEACRQIRACAPHTGIVMVTVRDAGKTKCAHWKPAPTITSQNRSNSASWSHVCGLCSVGPVSTETLNRQRFRQAT